MIDVWVCDFSNFDDDRFEVLLGLLPKVMQQDVLRYKFLKDRKSKLLGRLIVERFYAENEIAFSYGNWSVSEYKKPFVKGGRPFNISHSGDLVVVAFSDQPVGIDIEMEKCIESESLIAYFHPKEVEYFRNSGNQLSEFYFLWTRKEALLKAIGIGLLEGLDKRNCLESPVLEEQPWFLKSVQLAGNYHMALCTPFEIDELSIREIDANTFY